MNGPTDTADQLNVAAGSSALTTLKERKIPLNGPRGVVTVRTLDDDEHRDLTWTPSAAAEVQLIRRDSSDGLAVLRHSTAHILAQAVQNLFPGARLGAGPAIEDGFYYDFLTERPFEADDLSVIEAEMRRLIGEKQTFQRRLALDLDEIREALRDEPLKLELIDNRQWDFEQADEYGEAKLSIYDNAVGEQRRWSDLCRGPHVIDTSILGVFALTHTAAAYWRGDERRPQGSSRKPT